MGRKQGVNPYLPLDTYIPDGEPHVFGDRVYIYGSHDREGGDNFCLLDYEVWSAPVNDLTGWRCEGTIYRAEQCKHYCSERVSFFAEGMKPLYLEYRGRGKTDFLKFELS